MVCLGCKFLHLPVLNLLHLKRCPFSVSRSKYPERIDRRKNVLVSSNYKEFFQYLRGFFCVLCAFMWFFYESYQTKSIANGGSLMTGEVFRYAIKTSLSLNYNFTISLLFLNFKSPYWTEELSNMSTCKQTRMQSETHWQNTSLLQIYSQKHILIAPTAINKRTSLSLDDFIADTKKYIEIYKNHQSRLLLSTRRARDKF